MQDVILTFEEINILIRLNTEGNVLLTDSVCVHTWVMSWWLAGKEGSHTLMDRLRASALRREIMEI